MALWILVAPACACDPNHDWKTELVWSDRSLVLDLLRDGVRRELERAGGAPGAVLVLDLQDAYGAVPGRLGEGEEPRKLPEAARVARARRTHQELLEALAAAGQPVVPFSRVEEYLTADPQRAYQPAAVRALAAATGATRVVRLELRDYGRVFERQADAFPSNRHLYQEMTGDDVTLRIAVLDQDSRYLHVDEAVHRQLLTEMFWERPGQERDMVLRITSPAFGQGEYFHKNERGGDGTGGLRAVLDSLRSAP